MQPSPPFSLALRRRLFWGAVVVVVLAVATLLLLKRGDLREAATTAVAGLQAAGPVVFFLGMAVLPAIGFPMLPFSLVAGPAFGPVLGVPLVIACSVAAVLGNVALSYAMAAHWMRPVILRVLARLGYRLPQLPTGSDWQIVWLVRLMPGLPFWTQSYVLGLMRLPLVPYLVVSTLLPAGYISGTIVFGDALFKGHMRHALLGAAAVGLVGACVHFWRKRRGAGDRVAEAVAAVERE